MGAQSGVIHKGVIQVCVDVCGAVCISSILRTNTSFDIPSKMSYFRPLYSLLYTTLFTRQVVYAAGDDLALMGVATGRAAASTAKKADLNVGAELQVCY